MKRLAIAALLALPATASAHPGHQHFGSTNHTLSDWTVLGAFAAISLCAAIWLRRGKSQD